VGALPFPFSPSLHIMPVSWSTGWCLLWSYGQLLKWQTTGTVLGKLQPPLTSPLPLLYTPIQTNS